MHPLPRELQFYDKLSAFVATRTSSQCRSHHQKLFCKFKYFTKIREMIRSKIGQPAYKENLCEAHKKMETIERTWVSSQVKLEEDSVQEEQEVQEDYVEAQRSQIPTYAPVVPCFGLANPMEMMMNSIGWMNLNNAFPPEDGNGQHR